MFGGNPGGKEGKEDRLRLGDFWKLELLRPSREDVRRQCLVQVRRAQFEELVMNREDPLTALNFLREKLSAVVDHSNKEQETQVTKRYAYEINVEVPSLVSTAQTMFPFEMS